MGIQTVAIIGLGALGTMYGQHFAERIGKGNVRIVVNEERKQRYEAEGVYSNGEKCDFLYVDEREQVPPADLVIVAVKSNGLDAAVLSMQNQIGPDTILLSVLNGITSEAILGEAYGNEKVIPAVAQAMDATKIGNRLEYHHMGTVHIGIDDPTKQNRLQRLVDFFSRTEFPHVVEADIRHRMWAKFMLNVGVNQTVMVIEGTYGDIQRPGEARELMVAAMREVIPIAAAEGVTLGEADLDEYLKVIDSVNPDGMPSMRQDGLAQRPSEVELFAGTVLAKAEKYHLEAPVNARLYRQIKEMEARYFLKRPTEEQ